jgi:hypothetical protein
MVWKLKQAQNRYWHFDTWHFIIILL